MKDAEFTHYQFMATLDRRTCARCGERDGEIFALADMEQGENAPPMHPRCRCTICATFDTPKGKSRKSGERAAREADRERVPADMTYKDWRAVYVERSKTFTTWRAETDARYAAAAKPKLPARNYDCELAKAIGRDHYDKVRDLVEGTKHTNAAQIWCKFEDEMRVGSATSAETYHQGGKIYFKTKAVAAGDTISTPYQTLFHEGGHLIDWLNLKFNNATWQNEYYSLRYKSGAFIKAIDKDFKQMIKTKKTALQSARLAKAEEITGMVKAEQWRKLYDGGYISWDVYFDLGYGYATAAKKKKIIADILGSVHIIENQSKSW